MKDQIQIFFESGFLLRFVQATLARIGESDICSARIERILFSNGIVDEFFRLQRVIINITNVCFVVFLLCRNHLAWSKNL